MTKNLKPTNFSSSLGIQTHNNRHKIIKYVDQWLEDKKKVDGAEDLWRIHDKLYDLTNFVDNHPGGKFWLQVTKGLDITEAFEAYHLSTKPETLLSKYFIRKTLTPRNLPFTFKEDGFYKTLKRNVRRVWDEIPKNDTDKTKHLSDLLLLITVILIFLATKYSIYFVGILSGIMLGFVNISSHNYYHQKENFRSYYGDIFMSPSREWKIIHVLSHHFCTNTILDIQTYLLEPFLFYYPHKKSTVSKYLCYIYAPLILWPLLFIYLYCSKIYFFTTGHDKHVSKADLLPWIIPTACYFVTGEPLFTILKMWLVALLVGGLWFSLVGITTTHYHPDIFIDGDKPRTEEEMDWGIHQLDTVGDKIEVHGSFFWSFLMLGDHALHHLFPALDHGVLNHLYPVVEETLKEFNLKIRMKNTLTMVNGHFLTLGKEVGNSNTPLLS